MKIPNTKQIANFLSSKRQKKFGPVGEVTVESLKQSAHNFSGVPDDIDEGYVIGKAFNASPSGEVSFVIVFSSIRLSRYPMLAKCAG